MDIDWTRELTDQLDWHWQHGLRPRLDGLTDKEYLWEPVPGCWSIRRRADSVAPETAGSGEFVFEFGRVDPPPVTTIAWRLGHIITGVLGQRAASHFGGPTVSPRTFSYAGTAAEALAQLDETYGRWIAGVRSLGPDGLAAPCGPAEGPYSSSPIAALVLHINRETIHHGAEIALLRDLYRANTV